MANATPPPVEQQSANCIAPTYATDMLVCGDPELAAIDQRYREALQHAPRFAPAAFWEENWPWLQRRSMCARSSEHRACVLTAYQERLEQFGAAASSGIFRKLSCSGEWKALALEGAQPSDDGFLVIRDRRGLLGVAAMLKSSAWKPLLAYRSNGDRLVITRLNAKPITCRWK